MTDWTLNDAIALRDFLNRNPKFLKVLSERRPKIQGVTMESRAVTGSDANGFLLAVDAIEALQQDPQEDGDSAGFLEETKPQEL